MPSSARLLPINPAGNGASTELKCLTQTKPGRASVFATVSAVLAALGTDAQGNATITATANEAVTVDNVSKMVLQQHPDAFHIT